MCVFFKRAGSDKGRLGASRPPNTAVSGAGVKASLDNM